MKRLAPVLAYLLVAASFVWAQSLAEVAKGERERRKKNEKPTRVIDEAGLRQAPGELAVGESSVKSGSESSENGQSTDAPFPPSETPASSSTSSDPCASLKSAIRSAERRYGERITVTYKVPGRRATVRSGYDSMGNPVYSDVQNYETRTKQVSCSTAEGRAESECQSRKQEIDRLRSELRKCR
jgi:hypothetical protein